MPTFYISLMCITHYGNSKRCSACLVDSEETTSKEEFVGKATAEILPSDPVTLPPFLVIMEDEQPAVKKFKVTTAKLRKMAKWTDDEKAALVTLVYKNDGLKKTKGETMTTKWERIRVDLYVNGGFTDKDVEQYKWEALQINFNTLAEELYKFASDPKSNWSAATEEPKKYEDEILSMMQEKYESIEERNVNNANKLKETKTMEAIEHELKMKGNSADKENAVAVIKTENESKLKKGHTLAASPFECVSNLMSSFTDESSGEARKIEAQAKLKEAEGALFRAETERMTQTEQLSIIKLLLSQQMNKQI